MVRPIGADGFPLFLPRTTFGRLALVPSPLRLPFPSQPLAPLSARCEESSSSVLACQRYSIAQMNVQACAGVRDNFLKMVGIDSSTYRSHGLNLHPSRYVCVSRPVAP